MSASSNTGEVVRLVCYGRPSGTGAASSASWTFGRDRGGEDEGGGVITGESKLGVTRTAGQTSV